MQAPNTRGSNLSPDETARYARHIALQEVGVAGQQKLKASSILCIGSGGLGSPLLLYLAAAGIGQIGIVDFDLVEDSNLQRQIIHGTSWIKKPKTSSARNRIKEINPYCNVVVYEEWLTKENALEIMSSFDIICDCTDNFPSRYLINDASVILGKPNIYGSIDRFEGQATVFNLNTNSPNYRDLVPEPPPSGLIPSCTESGVMGVLPGMIGTIQATEAIKIITGIGKTLSGRLLVIDALSMTFRELRLCPDKKRKKIEKLIDYKEFCSSNDKQNEDEIANKASNISAKDLHTLLSNHQKEIVILDVRNHEEHQMHSIPTAKLIPLPSIESGLAIKEIRELVRDRELYVYCKSGSRSQKALKLLRQHEIKGINVLGGIDSWIKEVKPQPDSESN